MTCQAGRCLLTTYCAHTHTFMLTNTSKTLLASGANVLSTLGEHVSDIYWGRAAFKLSTAKRKETDVLDLCALSLVFELEEDIIHS